MAEFDPFMLSRVQFAGHRIEGIIPIVTMGMTAAKESHIIPPPPNQCPSTIRISQIIKKTVNPDTLFMA